MIISHSHQFIFIKSQKTAGTSIEAALSKYCEGDDVVTPLNDFAFNRDEQGNPVHHGMNAEEFQEIGQHADAQTIRSKILPQVWESYFKFSIARNPWDRVVSIFTWRFRRQPSRKPRERLRHFFRPPGDEITETRRRFAAFVREGKWETNDRFYVSGDHLCVDFVIRYENLAADFWEVCCRAGLPTPEIPHLKSGFRQPGRHYSELYDHDTAAIVEERHRNDIRLFNYRFETPAAGS